MIRPARIFEIFHAVALNYFVISVYLFYIFQNAVKKHAIFAFEKETEAFVIIALTMLTNSFTIWNFFNWASHRFARNPHVSSKYF